MPLFFTASFVDGDIEGICRDEVHVRVLAAYPVLQDVLEFERFVTKLLLGILWILLVEVENLLLCFRLNRYIFVECRRQKSRRGQVIGTDGELYAGRIIWSIYQSVCR